MSEQKSKIDEYFAKSGKWREELAALRAILLACPLVEQFKWRSPCYTYENGNVVAIWSLKDHCALAFFKGALLKDDDGLLHAPGENSRSMRVMRFTNVAEIAEMESVLKTYVLDAVEAEKAGLKVDFKSDDLALPMELMDLLDAEPDLKSAFEALTPGRRRGYVLYFSQPKQSSTRASRIKKSMAKVLEGKGLHDR